MQNYLKFWSGLGLQRKLQILIQGFVLVILLLTQAWISQQFERHALRAAQDRIAMVADGVINALNTLMAARVDDHDVIDDPKVRELFIRKMGDSEGLKELRVIRGKGVIDEFGPGLPNQKPVDDMDREVLANGKTLYRVDSSVRGQDTLRAVIPYIATKSFRGSKCLDCHGVDDGAVVGAISITSDIHTDMENIRRINQWLWLGQGLVQILLFFVIRWIVQRQLSALGAEPAQATQLAQRVAQGDLCTPIQVKAHDTQSMMAQLGMMQKACPASWRGYAVAPKGWLCRARKLPKATRTFPPAPNARRQRWKKPLPQWSNSAPPSAKTPTPPMKPTNWHSAQPRSP